MCEFCAFLYRVMYVFVAVLDMKCVNSGPFL